MSQPDFGPFTKKIFLPEKTINQMALDALAATKLMPERPGPVNIDLFCMRKWGWEEQFVDLGPDLMGRCAFSEDGVESIEVNVRLLEDKSRAGRMRVKSTKVHEIGHGLAHAGLFALKLRQDRLQPQLFGLETGAAAANATDRILHASREENIFRPKKKEWWEIQANMLMAALLMPAPLLRQVIDAWRAQNRPRFLPLVPRIDEQVAEVFDVSYQMAEIAVKGLLATIEKEKAQMEAALTKP